MFTATAAIFSFFWSCLNLLKPTKITKAKKLCKLIRENIMGVILIGQWLSGIEGIFKGALAESSRAIPCNLWIVVIVLL